MSASDIEAFLGDIEGGAPCGPNLEYDPDFVALEQDVLGKPEVQYGDTITAATPPDWKAIQRVARALLARSLDLRLVLHLLRANLALHGIAGLADGLQLLERALDERWDSVHPALDADDDMDPTLRINSLVVLTDRTTVLQDVKEAALLLLPGLGPLSLRTLDIATGELATPAGQDKITIATIELALRDSDAAVLAAARATLARAYDSVVNIEAILVRQVGNAQALSLDGLTRMLKRGRDFLAQQERPEAGAADAEASPGVDHGGAAATGAAPARAAGISGDIASRADVLRMLDKLLAYYAQHEPSSPLPLLLLRAKRLAPMRFLDIMADLAPDAMQQLKVIQGPQDED